MHLLVDCSDPVRYSIAGQMVVVHDGTLSFGNKQNKHRRKPEGHVTPILWTVTLRDAMIQAVFSA